jgi:hydroxyacylglutathione hydrolase
MFTGDTVFLGDVGRPDLATNSNITKHDLAGMLYDSVQKLKAYDDAIRIYPAHVHTHKAGSSCGKAVGGGGNFCTLGQQKANNHGFKHDNKENFINEVVNIAAPPKYFFYDSFLNQQGPATYSESVKRVSVPLSVEGFKTLAEKITIVDTRNDVGAGLIKGSYWLPSKGAIVYWLTSLISPETEFLLICEPNTFADIADRFLRVGYFNIRGYNSFSVGEWGEELNHPTIIGFPQLKDLKEYVHLDVRNVPELESGGVVENSISIPLPKLPERVGEVKGKEGIVVNCRTGLRARVAYSILAREGITATILAESKPSLM